ncbi:DNA replication and repair protein RecN [Candidatus Termititenax persephonae]|uniref:DNA repair protein RecN n=1 Tax=Candidatus Termititenax persephonae TaxID=2218525 RepID=A0A388THT5_9BACT|nr:DNA replication and repair protein RecN [Candidatus Termititenax persephonae]
MLLSLYLENYALIDQQSIEFAEGFNVITGETGAGKSIIVNALALIMGERASADFIKAGKSRAVLEAVFDIKGRNIEGYAGDEVLIITREISLNGRNLIKLNRRVVTQAELKKISRYLIDIHGQHQHQILIDPANHLEILDLFTEQKPRSLVREIFAQYHAVKKEYDLLLQNRDLRQEEKDFLNFQLTELVSANLQVGEYTELKTEKSRLDSFTEIAAAVRGVAEKISGLQDGLRYNKNKLAQVVGKETTLQTLADKAETLSLDFEDFHASLTDYENRLEFSPQRLDEINERLDLLNKLKRKHLKQLAEEDITVLLIKKRDQLQTLLSGLADTDDRLAKLEKNLATAEKAYLQAADELSQHRQAIAAELAQKIIGALQALRMPHTQFKINFTRGNYTADGLDTVEFLISANAGEPIKPLSKIASGGEISRVMLAIRKILAEQDQSSSMIFDEIDAGIGGETALAIAEAIHRIARKHQVICITHLAQIAAKADYHLRVEKTTGNNTTAVRVEPLAPEQREREIARMLSGKITENAAAHAQELLEQA